ncbi:glutamate--cysteine ligase [Kocuria sp. CNJ-770]|uniref:glutamate--cysteine ligase n=1 Tax=Kocuria sp. CNJ-770 TaxID=1904964 RepID=UPI00210092F8|nr:glutamate--cysteine ligase [Kocuria sp. CNJ-770]
MAALPAAPHPVVPHVVHEARAQHVRHRFGLTAAEQLTCGFHVHVAVHSRQEAVAVLDRIRVWLPVLLGLSANSPFWNGVDTGYASYRYQAWSRWPTAGPTEVFGTSAAYDEHRRDLLASGVPLDAGMLYFDARLCEHQPTVEVRVADVCLQAEHAAVLAVLVRALVETAARAWKAGDPAPDVRVGLLRAWMWQASHDGADSQLISPTTGTPAPAADVVAELLEAVRPVLVEYQEEDAVEAVITEILREGTGALHQRAAYRRGQDLHEVVQQAIETTHHAVKTAPAAPPRPRA